MIYPILSVSICLNLVAIVSTQLPLNPTFTSSFCNPERAHKYFNFYKNDDDTSKPLESD